MKKSFALTFIALILFIAKKENSYAQTSISTQQFNFGINEVKLDGSGNYIVYGATNNGITLTGCTSNFNVTGWFIGKYNPSSQCWYWGYSLPRNSSNFINLKDYDVDVNSNVNIIGNLSGTVAFNGSISKTEKGNGDIFVMQLNGSDGTINWVNTEGTSNKDLANGIKIDDSGNVIASGEYNQYITNGVSGLGKASILIAKYNSSGTKQWMSTFEGAGNYNGRPYFTSTGGAGVTVDHSGNIYQCGYVCGTATLYKSKSSTITIGSGNSASEAGFLIKYNGNGAVQWAKSYSASSTSKWYSNKVGSGQRIDVDGLGNLYIQGYWHDGMIDFGNSVKLTQPDTGLINIRANYIVKVNASGTAQWGKKLLLSLGNMAGLVVSANNNVFFLASTYQNSLITIDGATTHYYPSGGNNFFIGEYSSSGNLQNVILPTVTGSTNNSTVFGGSASAFNICSVSGGFMITGEVIGRTDISTNTTYNSILNLDTSNILSANGSYIDFTAIYSNSAFKTSGINQQPNAQFIVYPNPAENILNIESSFNGNISLIDISGKTLMQSTLAVGRTFLNISDLREGIYFLRTENGETLKILKR